MKLSFQLRTLQSWQHLPWHCMAAGSLATRISSPPRPGPQKRYATAHRFEVHIIGFEGESHCLDLVKSSQQQCVRAKADYTDGSMWLPSNVVLDSYTASNYISTPVPFRVILSGAPQPAVHPPHTVRHERQLHRVARPRPGLCICVALGINTTRSTDLPAIIKWWCPRLGSAARCRCRSWRRVVQRCCARCC